MSEAISEKIASLKSRLAVLEKQKGLRAGAVKLVLITKTVPVERILEAYQAGVRDFGENKIQELLDKKDQLPGDIRWHFVGRLQTNKVKYWLEVLEQKATSAPLLHSLDREDLAKEIERQAVQRKIEKVPCLIQVNSSGEATKAGFDPESVPEFVRKISSGSVLGLQGLMTIGPMTDEVNKIRESFLKVKKLQELLKKDSPRYSWDVLSMGMSGDYETAIEEGSTLIRIGSLIFGEREV